MAVIDSDSHVLETPATWEYLRGDEVKYKPMIDSQSFGDVVLANDGVNVQKNYWMIGPRTFGKDRNLGNEITRQICETQDIPECLRHMDELGIDIQVLYPTLYLRPITTDRDADLALIRSYNLGVADVCSQSDGRIGRVVMPPTQSPERIREDNSVMGTDYRHFDPSSEVLAIHMLRDDLRVDPSICKRKLESNAVALYGLK